MEALNHRPTETPPASPKRPSSVACGDTPKTLAKISRNHIALAIWSRTLPEPLPHFLDSLSQSSLPNERLLVNVDEARAAVIDYLTETLPPGRGERTLFTDDVCALIALFRRTTASQRVLIRLESVRDDSCRKFHADSVSVRLLTTYRGPGTQWLPSHGRPRSDLGRGQHQGIQWDTTDIRQLPRFAVGMFKGLRYPAGGPVAIHRSPPIDGTGTTRLLLAIDDATTGPLA